MPEATVAVAPAKNRKHEATRYKQLLFINEYPPSSVSGAPVIARQLLRHYDTNRLDVLCCRNFYASEEKVRQTYLDCPHHWVASFKRPFLRPRRVFVPIEATLDSYRLGHIMAEGRRLIKERGVEALYTMPYGCEFPLAAYLLHKETGLPLYVFETDYLPATARSARSRKLIAQHYEPMVRSAEKLWLTSPNMVRIMKQKHGVEGEFLFHFVDVEQYQKATREAPPLPKDKIILAYTGSINTMFWETMKHFCDMLNRGLEIDGRPVEMVIYCHAKPDEALLGPRVRWGGWVPLEQVPEKLAQAHMTAILVSFTEDPDEKSLIQTSLYTKTVDYLASGRPVLVVSPPYSGEVDYFREVTHVVDTLDDTRIVDGIRKLADDVPYRENLIAQGLELVRRRHSMEALHDIFLNHFKVAG